MAKPLIYRLFGVGKIPPPMMAQFEQEGILLSDDGVKGSVTYRDFSAPGKRFLWKRSGFIGAVVITNVRLAAIFFSRYAVNVPFSDERIGKLECSVEDGSRLLIAFDPSLFHNDWAGRIEYRFRTELAQKFLDLLRERTR